MHKKHVSMFSLGFVYKIARILRTVGSLFCEVNSLSSEQVFNRIEYDTCSEFRGFSLLILVKDLLFSENFYQ